jgi:hypothetical protein
MRCVSGRIHMTGLHRSRKKKHRGHYFGWYELIGRNQCHLKIAGGEGTRGPFNHFFDLPVFLRDLLVPFLIGRARSR